MTDILVVADEEWVLDDVRAALSEPRFTLHEISDPRLVAERLDELSADAVLIDMQIGSMGGMAVTRAVRNTAAVGGTAAPPVVLLLDRDADAFLAGRSGATSWVRKPFSSHELRAALADAMSR
ncbi:MAG: response regulator [Acidimicrobiia bacterium]